MVSMKDIARHCGVSVATVSKALNGQPDIGEETRKRIHDAAKQMGYMANSAARALKTSRTYNLGILLVNERRSGLGHEYFSTVLESFKEAAEAHGYDVTFIHRNLGGGHTSYLQHCRYRGVDGVAIACVDFEDPQILELVESRIPVVTIDRIFEGRTAVLSDNVNGVTALVRYVHSMGHRKIAFLHGERTAVTDSRLAGFYRTCQELGIEVPEEYVVECVYHDPDRCEEATRQLMSLPNRPTCILFTDDYSYIGGKNALIEAGLRIPEDISVVGYDGIRLAQMMRLTSYNQNALEVGKVAAEQLIRMVESPETAAPERIMVEGKLFIGNSVKNIR